MKAGARMGALHIRDMLIIYVMEMKPIVALILCVALSLSIATTAVRGGSLAPRQTEPIEDQPLPPDQQEQQQQQQTSGQCTFKLTNALDSGFAIDILINDEPAISELNYLESEVAEGVPCQEFLLKVILSSTANSSNESSSVTVLEETLPALEQAPNSINYFVLTGGQQQQSDEGEEGMPEEESEPQQQERQQDDEMLAGQNVVGRGNITRVLMVEGQVIDTIELPVVLLFDPIPLLEMGNNDNMNSTAISVWNVAMEVEGDIRIAIQTFQPENQQQSINLGEPLLDTTITEHERLDFLELNSTDGGIAILNIYSSNNPNEPLAASVIDLDEHSGESIIVFLAGRRAVNILLEPISEDEVGGFPPGFGECLLKIVNAFDAFVDFDVEMDGRMIAQGLSYRDSEMIADVPCDNATLQLLFNQPEELGGPLVALRAEQLSLQEGERIINYFTIVGSVEENQQQEEQALPGNAIAEGNISISTVVGEQVIDTNPARLYLLSETAEVPQVEDGSEDKAFAFWHVSPFLMEEVTLTVSTLGDPENPIFDSAFSLWQRVDYTMLNVSDEPIIFLLRNADGEALVIQTVSFNEDTNASTIFITGGNFPNFLYEVDQIPSGDDEGEGEGEGEGQCFIRFVYNLQDGPSLNIELNGEVILQGMQPQDGQSVANATCGEAQQLRILLADAGEALFEEEVSINATEQADQFSRINYFVITPEIVGADLTASENVLATASLEEGNNVVLTNAALDQPLSIGSDVVYVTFWYATPVGEAAQLTIVAQVEGQEEEGEPREFQLNPYEWSDFQQFPAEDLTLQVLRDQEQIFEQQFMLSQYGGEAIIILIAGVEEIEFISDVAGEAEGEGEGMNMCSIDLVHAFSIGPSVDVYINNQSIATNVAYQRANPIIENLPCGEVSIIVTEAGAEPQDNPIIEEQIMLEQPVSTEEPLINSVVIGPGPNEGDAPRLFVEQFAFPTAIVGGGQQLPSDSTFLAFYSLVSENVQLNLLFPESNLRTQGNLPPFVRVDYVQVPTTEEIAQLQLTFEGEEQLQMDLDLSALQPLDEKVATMYIVGMQPEEVFVVADKRASA
ncbi:hypothetical protein QOT17_012552 [Balamuthia mandrillaris]